MPGAPSSYLDTGNNALLKMLNTPIPGLDSGGFDQLSTGFDSAKTTGMSDLARRGLTTTGAGPEMEYGLQSEYNRGAAGVVQAGADQQNQERLRMLNALLGLGSPGLNMTRANIGSTLEDTSMGSGVLQGLFGAPTSGNMLTGSGASPGGLFSGDLRQLLSRLGF